MSWAVVVPTNRVEQFQQFMAAWDRLFTQYEVEIFVVCDAESAEPFMRGSAASFFDWRDFPDFIPRRSDMCRSLGIYEAWKSGATCTLSLDDDVRPDPERDLFWEYEEVFRHGAVCSPYLDVGALTSFDGQLRGFPFRDRVPAEVAVQYGGWQGVLDFDAQTQLDRQPGADHRFFPLVLPVPVGVPVTGCIMNCAWRTSYAPLMWQLPLYEGRYNRFGDIWSCLLQKKELDRLGKAMVVNGCASVLHRRASDPHANLEREKPGIPLNEEIWAHQGDLYDFFRARDELYAKHFWNSREAWQRLFSS